MGALVEQPVILAALGEGLNSSDPRSPEGMLLGGEGPEDASDILDAMAPTATAMAVVSTSSTAASATHWPGPRQRVAVAPSRVTVPPSVDHARELAPGSIEELWRPIHSVGQSSPMPPTRRIPRPSASHNG